MNIPKHERRKSDLPLKIMGLTQKKIAEKLGVSDPCINAFINGRRQLGKSNASKWQKYFALSAAWLMTGDGEMVIPYYHAEDGSVQVMGNASTVNPRNTIDCLVDLLKKKYEQIDRLIGLLEDKG